MEVDELIKVILASSVFAGIVSAIVSYFISKHLKQIDFRNEYYKEILKKRIQAYDYIEKQIAVLKGVSLDEEDGKPYHIIFSYGENEFHEFQRNLTIAIAMSLWIDDNTSVQLERMNNLFYNLNNKVHQKSNSEVEQIGKEYYQKISDGRFNLENAVKTGLYDLHNIKKIFKTKKTNRKRLLYKE